MSDRCKGFIVVLDKTYKDEGLESIKLALNMIKGVLTVDDIPADHNDYCIRSQVESEIHNRLFHAIYKKRGE